MRLVALSFALFQFGFLNAVNQATLFVRVALQIAWGRPRSGELGWLVDSA